MRHSGVVLAGHGALWVNPGLKIPDRVYYGDGNQIYHQLFPFGNNVLDSCIISCYYSRKGIKVRCMSNNKAVTVSDIGVAIRKKRKDDGLTLADAAALCGVGYRFMSDLENGKSTVQLGKVLQVLNALGVDIYTVSRKWPNE